MLPAGVSSKKRTHRQEKLARIYDEEILPIWAQRFGRMLFRDLELPDKCQVLDVACGTGYASVEVLRRMKPGSRLIAIEESSSLLDVARKKIADMGAKDVFFRTESAQPRLSFADDVYDVVLCNLGLADMVSPQRTLADLSRVTRVGGQVRCTLPLEGTFEEFYDIYREVLTKHDRHDTLQRLNAHIDRTYPTVADVEGWMAGARLMDREVDVERFTMLFRSSREFFYAPVIEYGPLSAWKEIAGTGQEMQDIFWYIKEGIDSYFDGRAFEITVVAGCLRGRKADVTEDAVTGPVSKVDAASLDEPDTLDRSGEIELGTDDIDLAEVESMVEADDELEDPVGLDAFEEGKPRPDHLDES